MSLESPIVRVIIVLVILAAIFLGVHYFTTSTETGQNIREEITESLFGVFTEEYDHNAERND